MVKEVIWSTTAKEELISCLNYWNDRNKSNRYSEKLYNMVDDAVARIASHRNAGRGTDFRNFRSIVVKDYLIFFEETETQILILSFWDGRQDPEKLKHRLE
jgi:toxin YoeB